MPDNRIGGPVTPPTLNNPESISSTPTPGSGRSTELATAYVDIAKLAAGEAGKKDWDSVNDSLKKLETSLAATYSNGKSDQVSTDDLSAILTELETVSKLAQENDAWSTLDIILSILSLGIFAIVKWSKTSDAAQVSAKAHELRGEIERFREGHNSDIFENGKVPEESLTTQTTSGLAQPALSRYLVHNQQIFRSPSFSVDGILDSNQELKVLDKQGQRLQWTPDKLAELKLDGVFTVSDKGDLAVRPELLGDGLAPSEIDQIAESLVSVVDQGYALRLSNPSAGLEGSDFVLQKVFGQFQQAVIHARAANQTHMLFGRSYENVPGLEPPMTYRQALDAMANQETSAEEFGRLNGALATQYRRESELGLVSKDMSFSHYKMQFAAIDLPNVTEDGLRWNDGDGQINAAEWAFLHLKINDLPDQRQHYNWCEISWKTSSGEEKSTSREVASDTSPATEESIKAQLAREGWATSGLTIDIQGETYTLPGKAELMPDVEDFSPALIKAIWTQADGALEAPGNIDDPKDLSAPATIGRARKAASMAISKWVMSTAMTSWAENSGSAIRDLIRNPIPDTQKVFLRQSNGAENADRIANVAVGQEDVITRGNDTGAFGKCAPISYFSASICGISTSARDSLEILQKSKDPRIRAASLEMEQLLTQVPMDEDNRIAIHASLRELKARATAENPSEVAKITQLVESFVDRLVVKEDAEGPYFEMDFYMPDVSRDGYMRNIAHRIKTGTHRIKLRPNDIQEYIEHTNRADGYRGGRQHMMDFFKDPSSLSRMDIMRTLGVGLIAAGVDKTLKVAGKKSGLLYGPSAGTVASLVYNKPMYSDYMNLKAPAADVGSSGFDTALAHRRGRLLSMLEVSSKRGGAVAVSMGYNGDTGHVNYVQDWGVPKIDGVEISSEALARTHMNISENSATSSAWNNDRVNSEFINPLKMVDGLQEIRAALDTQGNTARVQELDALIAKARAAEDIVVRLAEAEVSKSGRDAVYQALERGYTWRRLVRYHPEYRQAVRDASAANMRWMRDHLKLDHDDGYNRANVVIMPSNTERDDRFSDNPGDADRISGGTIGTQARGSANAADASYFVPLDALAGGWDDKEGENATGYANYKSDPTDQFIMLASMTSMFSYNF